MAEEKKIRKVNINGEVYDANEILKNGTYNLLNYANHLREKGLSDEQVQTIVDGITEDLNGIANGNYKSRGKDIQEVTTDPGKKILGITIKKPKITKYDTSGFINNFLYEIANATNKYEDPKPKNEWDINKFGIAGWANGNGYSSTNYDSLDELEEGETKRKTVQRREKLLPFLNEYNTFFRNQGFDTLKNDDLFDDDYSQTLNNLINNLNNMDDIDVANALRKLGAGDYARAFMSADPIGKTKEDLEKEAEERKKKEEEEKQKARQKTWDDATDELYNKFDINNQKTMYMPFISSRDFGVDPGGQPRDFLGWYQDIPENQRGNYGTYLDPDDPTIFASAADKLMSFLRGETQSYNDKNAAIILQRMMTTGEGLTDLNNGWFLINDSVNRNDGIGWMISPSGKMQQTTLFNHVDNQFILNELRKIIDGYIKNSNPDWDSQIATPRISMKKEGGEILKAQIGAPLTFEPWDIREHSGVYDRAAKKGRTVEKQEAADRYIISDNKSAENPNAGWSAIETARLTGIGLDITSMISAFLPGAGTVASAATGLTSTAINLGADIADDSVSGLSAAGNAVFGAAMDVLGLIPGFGSAAKTGKVVKALARFAPKLIVAVGTAGALANSGEIINSLKKVTDDNAKLTVEDWRNIAQAIGLVTGGTAAATRGVRNKMIKSKALEKDKVSLRVIDQATGKEKELVLDGKVGQAVREAAPKGKTEVEKALEGFTEFQGKYKVAGNDSERLGWRGFRGKEVVDGKEVRKWQNPISLREKGVQIGNVYDYSKLGGRWGMRNFQRNQYRKPTDDLSGNTYHTIAETEAAIAARKAGLETELKNANTRREGLINEKKSQLDSATSEFNNKKTAYDEANSKMLESERNYNNLVNEVRTGYTGNVVKEPVYRSAISSQIAAKNAVQAAKKNLKDAQSKLTALEKTVKGKKIKAPGVSKKAYDDAKNAVTTARKEYNKLRNNKKLIDEKINTYNKLRSDKIAWENAHSPSEVDRLKKLLDDNRTINTSALGEMNLAKLKMDRLVDIHTKLSDPSHPTNIRKRLMSQASSGADELIAGKKVTVEELIKDILTKYKYKTGGQINRSHLNSHLQYFKR